MAIQGTFVGMTSAELTTLRTNTLAAINTAMTAGASYSIGGRSHSRNLAQLNDTLAEVNYALQIAAGTRVSRTYANCSDSP
jgi:hypothetical protein